MGADNHFAPFPLALDFHPQPPINHPTIPSSGISVSDEREGRGGEVGAAAGEGVGRAVHQPRGAVEQDLGHGRAGEGGEGQDQVREEGTVCEAGL